MLQGLCYNLVALGLKGQTKTCRQNLETPIPRKKRKEKKNSAEKMYKVSMLIGCVYIVDDFLFSHSHFPSEVGDLT